MITLPFVEIQLFLCLNVIFLLRLDLHIESVQYVKFHHKQIEMEFLCYLSESKVSSTSASTAE